MTFDEILRAVSSQRTACKYWDVGPSLIVVGREVHLTILRAAETFMYMQVDGPARFTLMGIPYTLGYHVPDDYLKVLCETTTPRALASASPTIARWDDSPRLPRSGDSPESSHH